MAAGCIAVVPDRLAYPEYVPARFRYFSEQPEVAALGYQLEIESAADKIVELASMIDNIESPSVAHLGWNMLAPKYRQLIEEAVG
jgi:hypothetical protein